MLRRLATMAARHYRLRISQCSQLVVVCSKRQRVLTGADQDKVHMRCVLRPQLHAECFITHI
jgi:hypothetical protein